LGLKIGNYGLEICALKSPRQFFCLDLKIKWMMVCRLRLKTDGRMKTARDTRQDLAACFGWKQVVLGFPNLALKLAKLRHGWCMWHHRGGRVEVKLKMNKSM
jgi:hypothetical protein